MVICCKSEKNRFNLNTCILPQVRGRQPLGTKFWCQQKPLVGHLLQVSKTKTLKSDFIHFFFHDFIHVYSPGAVADKPLGRNLNVNRNILSIQSFVGSFKKKSLWSLTLYHFFFFFPYFIHVYSCRSGADNHRGHFDVYRNRLSLCSFATSFNLFWSLILYNFFHDFIHVYSPGAEPDNPLGTKF